MRRLIFAVSLFVAAPSASIAAERVTLTGTVVNVSGQPVEHATVLVWHAGVKKGYSTFCPSCYVDCGKHAFTDAGGSYKIQGLDPDLNFELLVVRDGFVPVFVDKVDPGRGPAPDATLAPRQPVTDAARVLRGRVVDSSGHPVADAVVEPQGVMYESARGPVSAYGTIKGLETISVTDAEGDFEVAFDKPALGIVVQVDARGFAPAIYSSVPLGLDRKTIVVTEGAVIRGRVVRDGKGLGGAEVGVIARQRGWGANLSIVGFPHPEIRVGTQPDGSFAISGVPAGVEWYVYGRMGSLPGEDASALLECVTKENGEEVNLGDIPVQPGLRVSGRVILEDGKPIPQGMRVTIGSDRRAFDSKTALLPSDGSFEFTGLRADDYSIFASVKGYRGSTIVRVEKHLSDVVVSLEPLEKR